MRKCAKFCLSDLRAVLLRCDIVQLSEVRQHWYIVGDDRMYTGVAYFCVSDLRNLEVGDGSGFNSYRLMK